MSNAIDILIVGGPADGRMVCMQRKQLSTFVEFPTAEEGLATYARGKYAYNGKLYHIATREEDALTNEQIDFAIVMNNHQPAWDLN
jgi:hypothetical protein